MQFGSYGYVDTSTSFKVTAPYGSFFLTGEEKELERLTREFAPWPVEILLIDREGEYLTRCGETVVIEQCFGNYCSGYNNDGTLAGVENNWSRSGRLNQNEENSNDIVSRA